MTTMYPPIRTGRFATALAAAAALTLGGAASRAADASAPAGGGAPLQIKVSEAIANGQLIQVPVNQGVLVDFSVPLKEVRIANPAVAEAAVTSPRQILISGKAFGTTQLIVWVETGEQRVFSVAVDIDLERLQASIRATVPRARVEAKALLNSVVLSGTVPDALSAERIMQIAQVYSPQVVNHMTVAGTHQVMLRCTVAEVNRSATRQLGFNGWLAGENFRDGFFVNNLDGINPANIGAAADANIRGNVPFLTGQDGIPITGNTTLSFGFPRVQTQIFVQALRENGLLRVLAEPNLVTLSGQEASFLAGGEFPIPVPQGSSGGTTITIEYREFGVRLKFTPVVLSDNSIRLKVAPEVSEPDFSSAVTISGFVVPGLTQRRVETMVELGPGQTFAIGGLLSEKSRAVSRKVPGLGDVPVIGALFSSVRYQSDETELVVLITPELVAPVNPDQITRVPGAEMRAPNDAELFLLGKTHGYRDEGRRPLLRDGATWPVRPQELYGRSAATRMRGPVGPSSGDGGL